MRTALLASLSVLAAGCASLSWTENARHTLTVAATVGAEVDDTFAPIYSEGAVRADQEAADDELVYSRLMEPYNKAADGILALRAALMAAQAVIDAYEAGNKEEFYAAAACVVSAMVYVRDALVPLGVTIPSTLDEVVEAARPVAGFACGVSL